MKCPNDATTLVMSERSGVEIDYCPDCRGVWLDRGELDKILERAERESPAPAERSTRDRPTDASYRDRDARSHEGYRSSKKKEHWLGELFG